MLGGMFQRENHGMPVAIARVSVAGLFGIALATKLIDPRRLLTPLEYGLGLAVGASSVCMPGIPE